MIFFTKFNVSEDETSLRYNSLFNQHVSSAAAPQLYISKKVQHDYVYLHSHWLKTLSVCVYVYMCLCVRAYSTVRGVILLHTVLG